MASNGGPLDSRNSSGFQSLELDDFEDVTSLLDAAPQKKRRLRWLPFSSSRRFDYKEPMPVSSLPKHMSDFKIAEDDEEEEGLGHRHRGDWRKIWSFNPLKKRKQGFSPLRAEDGGRWCPEEDAGFFSKLFFGYCNSLMDLGYHKTLNQSDLWSLAKCDWAADRIAKFEDHLEHTKSNKAPMGSMGWALWRTHRKMFVVAGIFKLVHDIVQFVGPFLLQLVLQNLEADEVDTAHIVKGLLLALAMSACSFIATVLVNQYFHILYRMGLHMKAELVTTLYQKALRVTTSAKADQGVGAIVNLQSNDASKLWNLPQYLHILWSGPFQIITTMGLLVRIIGWAGSFAGLGVTLALIPLNTFIGKKVGQYRKVQMKYTDQRVKLTTEVITGIKAIKLYSWEEPYVDRIAKLREQELRQLWKTGLLMSINRMFFMAGPILISLFAFGTYALMGNRVTASVAFPALALFNILRFPIIMLPMQIMSLIFGKVALDRIQKFMNSEEIEEAPTAIPSSKTGITVTGASFSWAPEAPETLHNINLTVQPGQLVMVVGEVGSGKSSLLSAILGEMHPCGGAVCVQGSIAYTAQDPWIQNMTVEKNVVMDGAMDRDRYASVVSACALVPDLELLPAGDQTEIGEKGVTLSGGQKHRVALARACYADADVYLLDDPLSAVDAHVGRHLLSKCISKLLAGKTRILVTHQLQFLSEADLIVVLRSGQITDVGTYDELKGKGVDFHEFELNNETNSQNVTEDAEATSSSASSDGGDKIPSNVEPDDAKAENDDPSATKRDLTKSGKTEERRALDKLMMKKDGKLTKAEDRSVGSVEKKVYYSYLEAWGPCFLFPLLLLANVFCERGLQVGQNYWLALWSEHTRESEAIGEDPQQLKYMSVYFGLGLLSMVFSFLGAIWVLMGSVNASRKLLMNLVRKVVRLPMSFFDTQPSGRLINRFTRDTESMDSEMAGVYSMTLGCIVSVLFSLFVVAVVTFGINLIFIIAIGYVYLRIQKRYLAASRELKRLDALALSPIFGHFNETLSGLQTVRAFRKQDDFVKKNQTLVDESNRAHWPLMTVNRWLSVNLDLLSAIIVFVTATVVTVVFRTNSGLAGLALTSALNLTGLVSWLIRQTTQLEVNMNSIERLVEYLKYDCEKDAIIPDNRPPSNWPKKGAITVENLRIRYRPELDDVLKGISFSAAGREKIGVCGRTGCGKSTLMMSLYRILEASGGSIKIDGMDIASIGLYDLRSKLSLVPQDPVVFSGSVRSNLDPFGEAGGDAQIWEALRQSGMHTYIQSMEGGLDAELTEGGGCLSVGQRQLLCMARALLRGSKILILDEATSNVDNVTDKLIQETIQTAFKDCTVLTIAHRLHTIINSDRILVLDDGQVVEFDSPQTLLKDPSTAFAKLVEEASRAPSGSYRRTKSAAALAEGLQIMCGRE